jgi:hypothetical protein
MNGLCEKHKDHYDYCHVCNYDELQSKYNELRKAIKKIHGIHNLGDAIYDVRERVNDANDGHKGSTWDHPDVVAYNKAVETVVLHINHG